MQVSGSSVRPAARQPAIAPVPGPPTAGTGTARSLVIQPAAQSRYARMFSGGFRISLAVTGSTNLDPAIFLFLARPPLPGGDIRYASFQKVCSYDDLRQFPASAPLPSADPAWFRLPAITLDFRDQSTAMAARASILAQAQGLLDAIDWDEELTAGTVATATGTNPFIA